MQSKLEVLKLNNPLFSNMTDDEILTNRYNKYYKDKNINYESYKTQMMAPMSIQEQNADAIKYLEVKRNLTQQDYISYFQQKEAEEIKAKGKIGFIEGLTNQKLRQIVPFYADLAQGLENKELNEINLKAYNGEKLTADEQQKFNDYVKQQKEEQLRGYSIGGQIGRGFYDGIRFPLEYLAIDWVLPGGGAAIKTATAAKVGKLAAAKTAIKVGAKAIGKTAAKGAVYSALKPTALYNEFQARQLNGDLQITDKGEIFFGELEKDFTKTLLKSIGSVWVENFTEMSGGALQPIGSGVDKLFGGKISLLMEKMTPYFNETFNKYTNETVQEVLKRIKWDGFIEENFEEYLAKPLNQLLGTTDEEYTLENFRKSFGISFEEIAVITGSVALQGGTSYTTAKLINRFTRNGAKQEDTNKYMRNTTELEKEAMLRRIEEAETESEKKAINDFYEDKKQTLIKRGFTEEQAEKSFKTVQGIVDYGANNIYLKTPQSRINFIKNKGFELVNQFGNNEDKTIYNQTLFQKEETYNKQGKVKTDSEEFKNWFGDSKVVNDKGEPLVVYHGTNNNFDTFSKDYQKSGWLGKGFYFTTDKKLAKKYGKVQKSYIRAEKIYKINGNNYTDLYGQLEKDFNLPKNIATDSNKIQEILSNNGYDGIYLNHWDLGEIYSVFNPNQIKSVDNRGTFSTEDNNIYNQTAYHGSPYNFDKFTLDNIGTGEGAQAHGYGLYFALDKKTAEGYKNNSDNSKLYTVDIPNDNVMLFEDKNFKEQSKEVQNSINKLLKDKSLDIDIINDIKENIKDNSYTGKDFYNSFNDLTFKETSELLNKYGIEGIRYKGAIDGECAVVFNDKSIDILEKLNQEQQQNIKGQYDPAKRLITLFDNADVSTFQHEVMHWWRQTLGDYAKAGSEQAQKDLDLLNQYVEATSNNWTVEQHEKLSRSWEVYLRRGIAPNKELQGTFARMREWFKQIYKSAKDITVNGKPVELDKNIIEYFDRILGGENIEIRYENSYNQLQQEIEEEREILYQEQPDFSEEEINAILKERFTEQLSSLEELEYFIEKENKKTPTQKVNEIFNTYQYDKQEFNELSNRVKGNIEDINKTIKDMKKDKFNIIDDMNLKDLIEINRIANRRLKRKPMTLIGWVRKRGGIYDPGGDVKQLDIKGLNKVSKYNRKGFPNQTVDDMRASAVEAGFNVTNNPEMYGGDSSTEADFLLLLDEDSRYRNIYREQDREQAMEYEESIRQREQAGALINSLHLGMPVEEFIELYKKAKNNNLVLLTKDKLKLIKSESNKVIDDVKKILKEIQNKEKTIKKELVDNIKNVKKNLKEKINIKNKEKIKNIKEKNKEKLRKTINDLKDKHKGKIKDIISVKAQVINMIKNLDLEPNNKIKFLSTIKKINTEQDFINNQEFIIQRINEYKENEMNKVIKNEINKELKHTSDLKKGNRKVGRYLYQDNLLFNDLRSYNKMNKITIAETLKNLIEKTSEEEKNSTLYNIKERFLNYKLNGADVSPAFAEQVLKDIRDFKKIALENKNEVEAIKYNNRKQDYIEIDEAIQKSSANKDTLKTKFGNAYRTTISNIYSMINSITNKKIADDLNIEYAENVKQTKVYQRVEILKKDLMKALNINKENQLYEYLNNNRKEKYILYDKVGSKQDINKMFILNIAAEMQNDLRRKQYINEYGLEQINNLISNLDDNDFEFIKVITKHFNEMGDYDKINKYYIENFNKDLKRVSGIYIPSKTEYTKESDFFQTFISDNVNSFSSLKERTAGENSKPIPQDLYRNLMNHINQVEYIDNVAPMFKKIESLLINNNKIKNDIEYKFGHNVFNTLKKQLNNLSFMTEVNIQSDFENIFNKVFSNWVVAKIASPNVFTKQLSAALNYVEDVNTVDFVNNFLDGLSHPKKTKDFMLKNFPMIEIRYKSGFNESLARAMEISKYAKGVNTMHDIFTYFTRVGDLGAVIFGGYAQIQSDLQNGISQEQAFKNFEIKTIRTQQSGLTSSLSNMQNNAKNHSFYRFFWAFKNQSLQYLRNIYDNIIMYQRGEISKKKLSKILLLYMVVQPAIFTYLGIFGYNLFAINDDDDDDENEKLAKKVIYSFIKSPFDGIPLLSDMLSAVGNKFVGDKQYDVFSMPLLDDIGNAMQRILKNNELTTKDYLNFVATLSEISFGAPIKTINRVQRKATKKDFLLN